MKKMAWFEVSEDDCIGCALCPERAPDNVEMVPQGSVARVIAQPVNEDEEQACRDAAEYCPLGALSVTAAPESSSDDLPAAEIAAAS